MDFLESSGYFIPSWENGSMMDNMTWSDDAVGRVKDGLNFPDWLVSGPNRNALAQSHHDACRLYIK